LGALGIIPDVWIFQFGINDMESFGFDVVVKDTPEVLPHARRNLKGVKKFDFDVLRPCF